MEGTYICLPRRPAVCPMTDQEIADELAELERKERTAAEVRAMSEGGQVADKN